ncbi:hypothetical protein [Ottowia thiooxydans]|uniref:Uncharacterized protein n=1 Tax=Ottowia thiooxydans TaxID=219182 RepID=A0ABV2QC47_9BURK
MNHDSPDRSEFMRRLFIFLFLVLTSVQLALAGLPATPVHSAASPEGETAVHAMVEKVAGADHSHTTDAKIPLGCDSSASSCTSCSPCSTCATCSHCHGQPSAIADTLSGLMLAAFTRGRFTWLTPRFASAEAAPIFKPPIA